MFFRMILLLIWKNLHMRKRKWFLTLCELSIPILMFVLVAKVFEHNHNTYSEHTEHINDTIFTPDDLYLSARQAFDRTELAYTPQNLFTEELIKKVQQKVVFLHFTPYKTEQDIISNYTTALSKYSDFKGVAVIFNDLHDNAYNMNTFKYTLRSTDVVKQHTNVLFPTSHDDGPAHAAKIYVTDGFAELQLIIDQCILTMKSEVPLKGLDIQQFPYPAYTRRYEPIDIKVFLSAITVISFSLLSISVVMLVVEEKHTGVKELQKLMGLEGKMIWIGWIINTLMVYLISITVIVILLKVSVFVYADAVILWVFLVLYCVAGILFCFAISTLFTRPIIAMSVGLILWIATFLGFYNISESETISLKMKLLLSLMPNITVKFGYKIITSLETLGMGAGWTSLFNTGINGTDMSLALVMFMFIVDCILYSLFVWYMDCVNPGKYGVPKSVFFVFGNLFSRMTKKLRSSSGSELLYQDDNNLFEKPPHNLQVGIDIQHLYKTFGRVEAVRGVSLKAYKGEITALLGHNGAGKTTTMSILSGMIAPSSGTVYYQGMDIFTNLNKFRESIGMCLQHNLLFSYLNVWEHMIFFGMLKGATQKETENESHELLKRLQIDEKRNVLVNELSGGMKRKLSLAIALVGKPKILILDEPTSGMDVESRRSMWDLLLEMRENRIILLTTHYMEEADALGDRIAIMDHGVIVCSGTTMFLKNRFGTGYQISLLKHPSCNVSNLNQTIEHLGIESEIKSDTESQVVYNISSKYIPQFPKLFSVLETNTEKFGISGIGVSYTTMEEVFIKASKVNEVNVNSVVDSQNGSGLSNSSKEVISRKNGTNVSLILHQLLVLCIKKWHYMRRRWLFTFIFTLIPLLAGIWTMRLSESVFDMEDVMPPITLKLSSYAESNVFIQLEQGGLSKHQMQFEQYVKENLATIVPVTDNMTNALLNKGKHELVKYKYETLIAAVFADKDKILYNSIAYHSLPIAINTYTVSLLRTLTGDPKASITTVNHPIQIVMNNLCPVRMNERVQLCFIWITLFIGFVLLNTYFIFLPHNERTTGIKHIQLLSHLSPITYWISFFVIDLLYYTIVVGIVLLCMKIADYSHIYTSTNELAILFTILYLYGINGILFSYVFSYFGKSVNSSFAFFTIINIVLNLVISPILYLLKVTYYVEPRELFLNKNVFFLLWRGSFLFPPFTLFSAIIGFVQTMGHNSQCMFCISKEKATCESAAGQHKYFVDADKENPFTILLEIEAFVISSVVYVIILVMVNYQIGEKVWDMFTNLLYGVEPTYRPQEQEDTDVKNERDRVDASKDEQTAVILVCVNLIKNYIQRCKKFTAVRGVNFTVSRGECFGLLGVNGAGKTTSFNMLTGALLPTSGNAFIQKDSVIKNRSAYLSKIGYCPQENSIIDQLAGKEMLELICSLRGMHPNHVSSNVKKWINILGLEEYQNEPCGTYSGGNKRKLCTALSLISEPDIVFLDEPTSGVDPVSRKKLHKLMKTRDSNQAVILTSHSMEECELLCDRLTIMVAGVMKCIGSPQYLKQRYAQGFTINVKLQEVYDYDAMVEKLKQDVQVNLNNECNLRDEHKGSLQYHVKPHFTWSNLFHVMSQVKDANPIIADYIITDTTLEQVFMSFTKPYVQQ